MAKRESKYSYYQSPFSNVPPEEITRAFHEFGKKRALEFDSQIQELSQKIRNNDPCALLAFSAFYGLTASQNKSKEQTEETPFLQHHLELLQALSLRNDFHTYSLHPMLWESYQTCSELIKKISQNYLLRSFVRIDPNLNEQNKSRMRLVEQIRADTHAVRNWGYADQIKKMLCALFEPLENQIEQKIGFKISSICQMHDKTIELVEKRLNEHRDRVRETITQKTPDRLIQTYYDKFPDMQSKDELMAFVTEKKLSMDQIRQLAISHSDLRLSDIFTFSLSEIKGLYPAEVKTDQLKAVLDKWSHKYGDLKNHNIEHFFLDNPVWKKPLIKINEETYFWPVIGLFTSFGIEMIEELYSGDLLMEKAYEKRRADFLESSIENILRNSFPNGQIFKGIQWRDDLDHKIYETDILLIVDSYALIIEAKSHKISPSARRGGEKRLERTVDEIVIAPSRQSARFAGFLKRNKRIHNFKMRDGGNALVDSSKLYDIIRFNITLDGMGALISKWTELRRAGFIKQDREIAPTMTLVDLQILTELLETSSEKLHYLIRRSQFELNAEYLADESDLMAFYIDTGFCIGETEFNGTPIQLYGASYDLDPYFMRDQWKKPAVKPKRKLSPYWKDLISHIEKRGRPQWSEITTVLLNVSYEDQIQFQKGLEKMKKNVKKNWLNPKHDCIVQLLNGPPQRRDAIVGYSYTLRSMSKERRFELAGYFAAQAMKDAGTNRAIVIGSNIDENNYPYSFICVFCNREQSKN